MCAAGPASDVGKLVTLDQQRAATRTGRTYIRETTYTIGDTVGDVEAARKGGLQIISVATGKRVE
ncbi:HAD hydrolase-like protein [Actinomadura welshii]|uniref:HAD hydrolase-like protein n=1 Tax=Actinomadura welshii TaxID=3103817 RepID=UPI0030B83965